MDITLSKRAAKTLEALDKPTQERIAAGIRGIPAGDIKPLKGTENTHRLRIGSWRILFSYLGNDGILIEKIAPRGEIYKGV